MFRNLYALAAFAALIAVPALSSAETKIGFVDVDLVASKSKSIQAQVREVEDKLKGKQQELDALMQQMKKADADLKARRSALADAEIKKQERAIQDLRDQSDALELEVNKQMRRAETEVMGPAVDKILAKVKEVGKAKGFDLILRSDVVIYGADTQNITELVIQELDKK